MWLQSFLFERLESCALFAVDSCRCAKLIPSIGMVAKVLPILDKVAGEWQNLALFCSANTKVVIVRRSDDDDSDGRRNSEEWRSSTNGKVSGDEAYDDDCDDDEDYFTGDPFDEDETESSAVTIPTTPVARTVAGKTARIRYRATGKTTASKLMAIGRSLVYKDEPRVVRESDTWVVVSKPAFWHCSGPGQSSDHSIDLAMLKDGQIEKATANVSLPRLQRSGKMESFHLWMMKKYPELETVRNWTELECGLCHRIDLETSGALLIAKTHRSRDLIWEQFRRRYVNKEYLLLCHGRISNLRGAVKTRLLTKDYGTNKSRRIKSHFTTVVAEGGEVALTEYTVCKLFKRKPWHEIQKVTRSFIQKSSRRH